MNRETIPITSEEQWLELRKQDITSTAMAGLFGLSPYCTVFELYHAKKTGLELPFETNDRMDKGLRMEGYAAQEVAIKEGWEVEAINDYIRLTDYKMGASFDFEATCPKRGKGILEIKALDFFRHRESWSEDEIPADKEVQIRQQLLCAGKYKWGAVAAFTSVYDYHLYFFDRDKGFEAGMITAAQEFWADVEAGREPKPDFYRDAPVIAELYKNAGGDLANFTDNEEYDALVARFSRLKEQANAFDKDVKAAQAELHLFLADKGGGISDNWQVKAGWTKGSPGTVVTKDMVGTVIGAKKPHRRCDIKYLKS